MRTGIATSRDPVALLDAALSALAGEDPAALDDRALTTRLQRLGQLSCRLEALVTRDVAAMHRRGAAKADGFASTQALLRGRLRFTTRDASRAVRVAVRLADLPDTMAAFTAGEISGAHAAAVCQTAADVGAEVMAGGAEKLLLDEARNGPPGRVWRLGRALRERLDPDGEDDRQARQFAARWLSIARTFDGAVSVQGVLDPVSGELLRGALDAFDPGPGATDSRSPGQRRVDALAEASRIALGSRDAPLTGEQRPRVTVTVSLETLRGLPGYGAALLGASDEPVCAQTARRLACDAGVIPAVLGGAAEPLDVGRLSRTVPTGIRRALVLRDRGCRFPGCDRPAGRCDAHHVHHWANGGPTSVTNLVLLCAFHHWLVHEGRWTIDYRADVNRLTAAHPDGTPYDLTSSPRGQSP